MALTAEELSEQLVKAGLLTAEQIQVCCAAASLDIQSVPAEKLAKQLVRDARLTLFQAQLAISGKASSLVIGSYVVLEKLGQGGMGQVFKARHKTMRREVALKVISPSVVKDATSLGRFQREVEAAAQLNHPNIVTAHDAGEFKGTHYLVMEYIRGKDLSSLVRESGPMMTAKAVVMILQTAKGLDYAHKQGIIHRDIKPANLLLDESGSVKILDMGLARYDAAAQDHPSMASLTGTGVLMGTIDYMSPEQAMDSRTADARSDIYSLGCTFYFLLSGKAVYEEDTIVKRLMAHQSAPFPALPILDMVLQQILERMIAKKAADRYASCDELADDLQRWLDQFTASSIKATQEMPLGVSGDISMAELRPPAFGPASAALGVNNAVRVLPALQETPPDTTPSSAAFVQTAIQPPTPTVTPGTSKSVDPAYQGGKADAEPPSGRDSMVPVAQQEHRSPGKKPSSRHEKASKSFTPAAEDSPEFALNTLETAATTSGRRTNRATMNNRRPLSPSGNGGKKSRWVYGGLGGGAALLALLAVILLRVKTPIGTIMIETDQPEIAGAVITVDEQQKITLETGNGQKPIEFQADEKEHTLKVTKGGFETFTQKFTIKAGELQTITVRLEPYESAVAATKTSESPEAMTSPAVTPMLPGSVAAPLIEPMPVYESKLLPIDYAAERKAAEFLANWLRDDGSKIVLRKDDGAIVIITSSQRVLPDERFVISSVSLSKGADDSVVAHLEGCTRIEGASLVFSPMTANGLKALRNSTTLQSLNVSGTAVGNGLKPLLSHWPNLQGLEVSYCSQLVDEDVALGTVSRAMKTLGFSSTKISDIGVETLSSSFPELTELDLSQDSGENHRSLSTISFFPKLAKLSCAAQQLTELGVQELVRHPAIVALGVSFRPSDETLDRLLPLSGKLRALTLFTNTLIDAPPSSHAYRRLAAFLELEDIVLSGHQGSPSDSDLLMLASLPKLKSLHLAFPAVSSYPDFPDAKRHYTVAGIEAFRELRPDVHLNVDGADLPPTAKPGTVPIPKPPEPPSAPVTVPPESLVGDPALAGTLAPTVLRMAQGSAARPPFTEHLRPGEPLGEFAAVSRPGKVNGLLSWSIEPLVHRGNYYSSLAVSPQGIIATGGSDCAIRLWNSDWQLLKVLPGHANDVHSLGFSPDGQNLASVSRTPREFVAMWDVGSGQLLWSKPYRIWIGRLSWAPDGTRLAVCEPNRLLIINPANGDIISELASPEHLLEAAWSSDSRHLAVVRDSKGTSKVRIIEAQTMNVIQEFLNSGGDTDAAWSADGRWLSIADSFTTGLYDAKAILGGQMPIRLHQITKGAKGIEFSPDSTHMAISGDGHTSQFRTSDWKEVWSVPIGGEDVHWSPDAQCIVCGNRRYSASDGKLLNAVPGFSRTILGPSKDGGKLATVSENGLRIWNTDDGTLLNDFPQLKVGSSQLQWNSDGTRLLRLGSVDAANTIAAESIDPATGQTLHTLNGHSGPVWRIACSPVGTLVATAGEDGQCLLWETSTGTLVRTLKHSEPQWWLQWSADGKLVASGSRTAITVWDSATGEQKRAFKTLFVPFWNPNVSVAADAPFSFMKDPSQLTVNGKDGTFDLLNINTGQMTSMGAVLNFGGGSRFTVSWSADYATMGSATGYREFELFQPGSAEPKIIRFCVHPHWLPDGRRVIAGENRDGFVMGFDIKPMRRLGVLLPELPNGEYIAIGPDGNYKGSPKCSEQVVVVALHTNGSLKTYSLEEFAETFGWQNDPTKVRLLKLGR